MPTLTWAAKSLPEVTPTPFVTDSIIYPQGVGYRQDLPVTPASDSTSLLKQAGQPANQLQQVSISRQRIPTMPENSGSPANRLILGDNLVVMTSLLPAYEGKIDLIYADPPFFTNRAYPARVGRGEDSRRPSEWRLAEGYGDHWSDLDAYLDFLYPRLVLMHRLLASTGTFYLHLDWHANAYARLLLDEIYGPERLLNEIIWCYHGPSPIRSAFNRKHDTLLAYTKSGEYTFNVDAVRQPYDPSTVKTFASSPKAGFGKVPNLERGKVPEDWWYFPVVARLHTERTGYPTQKPEALLERIVLAASNPGDLVADFFCGSGTTAVAAARHQRKFITNDVTYRAVHTTRARLVQSVGLPRMAQTPGNESFSVQTVSQSIGIQNAGLNLRWGIQTVCMDEEILPALDYWEVDPDWDGIIFRSAAQAVRPRKTEPIASELKIPVPPGKRSCVRWVTVDGQTFQTIIER
jgi:DNA modification methylase